MSWLKHLSPAWWLGAIAKLFISFQSLMKKEMAHAGFPEAAFQRYAEILVDLGFKVARIEQTETPVQMSERCATMTRPTKFDKGNFVELACH